MGEIVNLNQFNSITEFYINKFNSLDYNYIIWLHYNSICLHQYYLKKILSKYINILTLFNMYITYNTHWTVLEKLLLVTFINGAVKYLFVPLPDAFSLILNHSNMYKFLNLLLIHIISIYVTTYQSKNSLKYGFYSKAFSKYHLWGMWMS